MIRSLLIALFLIFSTNSLASDESVSITIKPSIGLSGTKSFNIHSSGEFTVLRYESPTEISEETVNIEPEKLSEVRSLAHGILQEFMATKKYSQWPEQKETISVSITQEKVTKSISTRRFSKNISALKDLLVGISK
jgi:hypothetical protein